MELLLGVGVILYVLYPLYLGNKIKRLEGRITELEAGRSLSYDNQVAPATLDRAVTDVQLIPIPRALDMTGQVQTDYQTTTPYVKGEPSAFVSWVKQDFMMKLGALLLLLAFGWLVSYAFANNWIGPFGRISLGLLLGVIFLGAGVWRIRAYKHQGGIFTVVGATTVLMTLFAAREMYDMFTPLSALIIMFLTVVFVAFVSVRYQSQALALAGLIMGCVAPLLTNSPQPDIQGLFTYLLIVVFGTLWVVAITGWSRLTLAAMILTFVYSLPFMFSYLGATEQDTAIIFSFIFVSVFFVANTVSLVRRHGKEHSLNHSLTALGSALFLFIWIQVAVASEWQSLLYVTWALVFSVGTYIVFYYTENRAAFYLYGGTGVALIAAATAAELDGATLTIAYLFEVAVVVLAAAKLKSGTKTINTLSVLFVVPVVMALESASPYLWRDGIMHEHFAVITLTVLVLGLVGWNIMRQSMMTEGREDKAGAVLMIIASIFMAMWVWLVAHALLADDVGTMLSLVIYTVTGIAGYIHGQHNNNKVLKLAGITLITFVMLRLLVVDVWEMEIVGRIITFFVVGILFISTAFIRRSKRADASNNIQS